LPLIEIWDAEAKLDDLVDLVVSPDNLRWSILEMWGVSDQDDVDILSIEQQIVESPTGLELSAEELRHMSRQLAQFIDGIVVGYRGAPPTRASPDLRTSSEVVIEAIDSTLWRIYTRDRDTFATSQLRYLDVRHVPEVALPAVHRFS